MKGLMAIMGLIFAILFGLVLYTHYDTKKFIQNLPQSPTMKGEVEKIPSPRDIEILQNAAEPTVEDTVTVLENPNDFHEHSDFHEHKHPDDSLLDSTPFLESNVTPHMVETLEETMIEVQPSAGWVPWRKVGPDGETIVLDRDAVIAEFGNTPKANAYLELARKINTADSYTAREIYELIVLEKEFTQDPNILPSHIEKLRQRAAQNPDAVIRSWRSLKNDPNITIRIVYGAE